MPAAHEMPVCGWHRAGMSPSDMLTTGPREQNDSHTPFGLVRGFFFLLFIITKPSNVWGWEGP